MFQQTAARANNVSRGITSFTGVESICHMGPVRAPKDISSMYAGSFRILPYIILTWRALK